MRIKYFIFGLFVTVFSVLNYSSADDFSQCKENGNCLYCMCDISFSSCYNQCINDNTMCSDDCNSSLTQCYESCDADDTECFENCESDLTYCNSTCDSDSSMCQTSCFDDNEVCSNGGDNIFSDDGNDYGQCFAEYLPGGDNPGGDNTGGELIGQLSPVITGLSSAVVEIIPYIVYIGLGVLGAILGFVAIKWLINWLRSKVLSPFK